MASVEDVAKPATEGPRRFAVSGAQFDMEQPDSLLEGAGSTFEPILTGGPDALPEIAILRAAGSLAGRPALRLQGRITMVAPEFDGPIHPAVVGLAYVAPLMDELARLVGPRTGRLPRAEQDSAIARPTGLHDPATGLAATVTYGRPAWHGRVVHTLESVLGFDDVDGEDLEAFVRMLVDLAGQQAGQADDDAFLAGRQYVLARPEAINAGDGSGLEAARLDRLGGLDDVVRQLRDVADSFQHPEAMARWGARRPQGILMWGPPGTGKTTLAKALATEIGGTLREIRTPDILEKWVGQSERNIKRIFTQARSYRTPTVLLFDEFDSIIGYTGAPVGAADQVANSVAGIFKQEMNDLIEHNPNVIVVATTNFPERVDDSLIRSGRFDVKIPVPLPDAHGRADILAKVLEQLTRRHSRSGFQMFADDIALDTLAEQAAGLSGADLKEALRRAQLAKAMQEARGSRADPISQEDLSREIQQLRRHPRHG